MENELIKILERELIENLNKKTWDPKSIIERFIENYCQKIGDEVFRSIIIFFINFAKKHRIVIEEDLIEFLLHTSINFGTELFIFTLKNILRIVKYTDIIKAIRGISSQLRDDLIKEVLDSYKQGKIRPEDIVILLPACSKRLSNLEIVEIFLNIFRSGTKDSKVLALRCLNYLVEDLGTNRVIFLISRIFAETDSVGTDSWGFLLPSISVLYRMYLDAFSERKKIVELIMRFLEKGRTVSKLLVNSALSTPYYEDVASFFWVTTLHPDAFDAAQMVQVIMRLTLKHKDKILTEASSALYEILKRLPAKKMSALRGWIHADDGNIRAVAALTLNKILQEGDSRVIKYLILLAKDRKSKIRRIACNGLMSKLQDMSNEDYKNALYALIYSKWSRAVKAALQSITFRYNDIPIDELRKILLLCSKDPRTSTYTTLIDILYDNWKIIDTNTLALILKRMISNIRDRKELAERLIDLTKKIMKEVRDEELVVIRKYISQALIPRDLKKKLLTTTDAGDFS